MGGNVLRTIAAGCTNADGANGALDLFNAANISMVDCMKKKQANKQTNKQREEQTANKSYCHVQQLFKRFIMYDFFFGFNFEILYKNI